MFASSHPLNSPNSRPYTHAVPGLAVEPFDSSYFTLAAPNPPSYIAGGPPHPSIPGFSPVESPPAYLTAPYTPASPLKPAAQGVSTENMMLTQRDMGYGYMPSPMGNPLQYGATGPSYSPLGPLGGYYSEPPQQQQAPHQRSYSTSSRPGSISGFDYQPLGADTNTNTMGVSAGNKRRRTSENEARRLNKMRVRRSQGPSLLDQKSDDGSQMVNSQVDLYSTATTPNVYVPDRPAMPSPYRHDYGDISPGQTQYSPPFHQPSYSMGPLSTGTLAPPLLPGSNSGYNPGRSSPLLHGPLPPASAVTPQQHAEPIVVGGGREKPQCWDHGCNGREFSTFSNLLRHQREKSGSASKSYCPHCGAEFTRTTARNGHVEQGKCKTRKTSDASNNPPRP